ncbi:MAG: GNAT family N-acetyltransferase [Pseudomonadota bacterium]
MTPERMAEIYAAAFPNTRAWTAAETTDMLAVPGTVAVEAPRGFALVRVVPPEAELLTIAVAPGAQRHGQGETLLKNSMVEAAKAGATTLFLEVDATNTPARALYAKAGFSQMGHRKAYYAHPDGTRTDALILSRSLSAGKTGDARAT